MNDRRRPWSLRGAGVAALVMLTVSCGSVEELTLDVEADEALDELTRRMALTVVTESAGGTETQAEVDPTNLEQLLINYCAEQIAGARCTSAVACDLRICATERDVCVANQLWTIATSVSPTRLLGTFGVQGTVAIRFSVPDQPTRVELGRSIVWFASETVSDAGTILNGTSSTTCSSAQLTADYLAAASGAEAISVGEFFATSYGEALVQANAGADIIRQASMAVSDEVLGGGDRQLSTSARVAVRGAGTRIARRIRS